MVSAGSSVEVGEGRDEVEAVREDSVGVEVVSALGRSRAGEQSWVCLMLSQYCYFYVRPLNACRD